MEILTGNSVKSIAIIEGDVSHTPGTYFKDTALLRAFAKFDGGNAATSLC